MRTAWCTVALVASCGRIDFTPIDMDAAAVDALDAMSDGCPAGFVRINGNAGLGTLNFCVMRTEARAWQDTDGDTRIVEAELDADGCATAACDTDWPSGTHLPVSILPVTADPWRSVSAIGAQTACRSLGARYDLMSNREWMTIARAAELDPLNWFGKVVGNMRIVQGHIDSIGVSAIADPQNGYTGTGNSDTEAPGAGWEQRRTLYAGGAIIWDLPGNYQEWVDWTLGGPLDGAPTPCTNAELPAFTCAGITASDFQSSTGTYDSTVGVGTIIGGSGNATRRGGQGGDLMLGIAGIYALNMNRNQTGEIFAGTSFRCVYRP